MLRVYLDRRYFHPGEDINGRIMLEIFRELYIKKGYINFRYDYLGYDPNRKLVYSKNYLDWEHEFIKSAELRKGKYEYRFNLKIPKDVPPSFRGRYVDGVIKYEAKVEIPYTFDLVSKGEVYIVDKCKKIVKDRLINGGGGDIQFTIVIGDPLVGFKEFNSILMINKGSEIRRISIELCIGETLEYSHLGIFKNRYHVKRCIARRVLWIGRKPISNIRFKIDLKKPFRGPYIYTSPYISDNIRIMPYLRISFYRSGRVTKTYEIPVEWYVWSAEEVKKEIPVIKEEIKKLDSEVIKRILEYFEKKREGDPLDIHLYLFKKGYYISITELSSILDNLVSNDILEVSAEDPLLRKYRIKL